ncbi:hypothetical protein AXA44_45450 [Rhodococcus sp. SC4]|nr:hypothetical protein AXA44_45450 [Rhodococcus sp. SC4]
MNRRGGSHVTLLVKESVTEIVWKSPGLNLFTNEVADQFEECLGGIPPGTRALLLRAEGKVFCGGVDVHEFESMVVTGGRTFSNRLLDLIHRLEELEFPTLAVVHGLNLTIGMELVLACDFIFASSDASMGLVEAKVGLTPAAGGVQRLVSRVGLTCATRMVMTGDVYSASTLKDWGLIDTVVDPVDLADSAGEFVSLLSKGPTKALAAAKVLLRSARDNGPTGTDWITPRAAGPIMNSKDARRGVRALLDQGPGTAIEFHGE